MDECFTMKKASKWLKVNCLPKIPSNNIHKIVKVVNVVLKENKRKSEGNKEGKLQVFVKRADRKCK